MSYTKNVTMWCEGKDCAQWVDGESGTVAKARERARAQRWTFKDGKDYCPVCSGAKVVCLMCARVVSEGTAIKDGRFWFCSDDCWDAWNE